MADEEMTTIWISKKTKERFDKLGNLKMTQDDVLNSLIDFWERYNGLVDQMQRIGDNNVGTRVRTVHCPCIQRRPEEV